jgi:FAD:protein FMN transferase
VQRHTFRAMGTDVEALLDVDDQEDAFAAFSEVEAEFERIEAHLSRFRPESELSRLNRDRSIEASPTLLEVTRLALRARERTAGRFDPTVHAALVAAGYDRTFEEVPEDGPEPGRAVACGGAVSISRRRIRLEAETALDFGGIGKGYAVDRALALLRRAGPCVVNAGGDLAVTGRAWPVGVETSGEPLTLELSDGALATSGRDRRSWRRGGALQHHIIDPATGRPAGTGLLHTTVVAPTAVEAEVLAKVAFLAGEEDALRDGMTGVLVTADGRTVLMGSLR